MLMKLCEKYLTFTKFYGIICIINESKVWRNLYEILWCSFAERR